MATEITNYQCPACTGPLHFAADSGKLECEYCDSSFTVAEVEEFYREKEDRAAEAWEEELNEPEAPQGDWDTSDLSDEWGKDGAGMRAYNCPSCGAQLICDESTAATSCPYCGNPSVVPGQFSGALRPDYVIPFRVEKEKAVAALRAHFKGKVFLPSAFSKESQLEKVQGVYVPFWLFDGTASGSCAYEATQIHKHMTPDKEITTTRIFEVRRKGSMNFEKIPVDASSKMPDGHMDAIEPFDYGELKPFSTAYFPGFLADKYDVEVADCQSRADERCEKTFLNAMEDTVTGYHTQILKSRQFRLNRGKVHYAMLPVWLMHVKWSNRDFLFAINGQTGKLAGDLPVDWGKVVGLFAAISVPLCIVGNLLVGLLTG